MKKEIVIGTGNRHKLAELKHLLRGLKIKVTPITALGKKVPRVRETGRTFDANAVIKARAYSNLSDKLTLADDSGICVDALKGGPGVYSARFAGSGCTYEDNNRKLLKALKNPRLKRNAHFCSSVALYKGGKQIKILRGVCQGRIAKALQGKHGFGYDPIFIPKGFKKTFAELSPATKNRISHRGKALKAVKQFLKNHYNSS